MTEIGYFGLSVLLIWFVFGFVDFFMYDSFPLFRTLISHYKWYLKKLTFDQKALLSPKPGLLIFNSKTVLYQGVYIDTKYMFNYLGITVKPGSFHTCMVHDNKLTDLYQFLIHYFKHDVNMVLLVSYLDRLHNPIIKRGFLSYIYDR